VLAQGKTPINGPHQGAWVDTPTGESWFIHFQDKGAYGRVVHLEPMQWVDDWPIMGDRGEPVLAHKKPNVGKTYPVMTPAESDEFNGSQLGLQWQWAANTKPGWVFPAGGLGFTRLFCITIPEGVKNFWDVPNLLLQKFPAPEFTATAKVAFTARANDEKTGLIVMGTDYAYLSVTKKPDGLLISQTICRNADRGAAEKESQPAPVKAATLYLRVKVSDQAVCLFSYSTDGTNFTPTGESFTARPGRWIGAKVGLFAVRSGRTAENGYADYDWFRVE
jgi:beta-xylosidase